MTVRKATPIDSHVVDILGSTKGRDQPIMLMEKALLLVEQVGVDAFNDPNTVFFDPFCKAGEILLAAAIKLCVTKNKQKNFTSIEEITDDIYLSNRFFALAPDERHYLLSLRTFYGNERSHNTKFTKYIKNGNYLSEIDGNLKSEKFEKEFKAMVEFIKKIKPNSRIIAVGNPPYQEADEGFGGSAKAIYNFFTEKLMDSSQISEFVLVIPSRWFAVGKGVDDFREKILKSTEIKTLHYFKRSKDVFPTVDILGGVCFFHYQKGFSGKTNFIEAGTSTEINLSEFDIIPDDPKAYPLIRKIKKISNKFVSGIAWSRNPFGLSSTFFRDNAEYTKNDSKAIKCYSRGRKIKMTSINMIKKNKDKVDMWKVVIPSAYAPGSKQGVRRVTLPKNQFFLIPKGEITTETYSIINVFTSKAEAERFIVYLQTDFARYFLGLRKITQHVPKDRWDWVPLMDTSKTWTDIDLYNHFKITKEEQEHIKKKVQEWS